MPDGRSDLLELVLIFVHPLPIAAQNISTVPDWYAKSEQFFTHGHILRTTLVVDCDFLGKRLDKRLNLASQLPFGHYPSILAHKILFIAVDYSGQLLPVLVTLMRASQLRPQLLPLILSNVDRVTAVAVAVFASVRW